MTDLTVRAIVTAVDNLTPTLRAMAANLAGVQAGMHKTGAVATTVGAATTAAMVAPLASMATFAIKGQEDIDRALRQYQVVGNASIEQRQEFEKLVMGVGPKLGLDQLKLIQGGAELLQAGLSPEDLFAKGEKGVTLFERLALGAKVAHEPLKNLSEQLQLLAQSLNFPMETPGQKAEALLSVLGTAIVAPRFSPDTPKGHMDALKQFGPLLRQMIPNQDPLETLYQASALQNTLAKSFPGSQGGMALKTILQRLQNATSASRQQMMLWGFDYGKGFGFDATKAQDPASLYEQLARAGIDGKPADAFLRKRLAELKKPGADINLWKTNLGFDLPDVLGIDNKSERGKFQRSVVKKAVDNFVAMKAGGLDVAEFLQQLSKMDVSAFRDFAGLHHAPKAAILAAQGTLKEYARILQQTRDQAPGAVDQGAETMLAGWAYSLDRVRASLTTLRNALWNTGAGDMWIGVMTKLSDAMLSLSAIDPGTLQALGKGLTYIGIGAAGLAGAGVAMQGFAFALAPLLAMAANPFWLRVAAAGGLGYLLFGGMGSSSILEEFKAADRLDARDPLSKQGAGANVLRELSELADNVGGAIGGLQGKLGEAIGSGLSAIGVQVTDLQQNIAKLFGMNVGDSPLVMSLRAVEALLRTANDSFKFWEGKKLSPQGEVDKRAWDNQIIPVLQSKKPAQAYDMYGEEANSPGLWQRLKNMFSGSGGQPAPEFGSAAAGPAAQPVAKLEGSATVSVTVKVEGPGQVTGIVGSDSGHIKMKTGASMPDANSPLP